MATLAKSRRQWARPKALPAAKATAPTLVVLTSFFPESRRALHFAAGLAGHLTAPLVLLHLDPVAAEYPNLPLRTVPADRRELRRDLQLLADELHQPATIELRTGLPGRVLPAVARQHAPALFVLGRPADEQADFALHQAILEELRAAHLPLLLVPEKYTGPTLPQHLAVATDDEPFALHARARTVRLLLQRLLPSRAMVVTASPLQDDNVCAAALHYVRSSGLLPDTVAFAAEGFYANGHPEQALLQAVATTQADWLVLLARPRRFLDWLLHRSITKRLLRHSPVPVLVVPTRTVRPQVRNRSAGRASDNII